MAGMGDGLGRAPTHTSVSVAQSQQHMLVNKPTTPHGIRADVDSDKALNLDNQVSDEELQSYTCPGVNAIMEGSNTIYKPPISQMYPTEFDMQLK